MEGDWRLTKVDGNVRYLYTWTGLDGINGWFMFELWKITEVTYQALVSSFLSLPKECVESR